MRLTIAIIGLSTALSFWAPLASAQNPDVSKLTTPAVTVSNTKTLVYRGVESQMIDITPAHLKKKTTSRVVRIVRKPLPGQSKAIRSVSKGRVIHNAGLLRDTMNVYRPATRKTSTPNLYRD